MRGFWPLLKRELFAMFVTPLAWVMIVAFLFITGGQFYLLVLTFSQQMEVSADQGPVQTFFGGTWLMYLPLLILCPALTMRAFAEERRSGTIETLLTAPVGTTAVVLSKFFAALITYVVMWAPTTLYMILLRNTGELDWNVIATGYAGILGIGSFYVSIGILASAMTRSQMLAMVFSSLVLVSLFGTGLGELFLSDGPWRDFCGYVSAWSQMEDFAKGVIDLRRIVFDLTLTVLPLFATVRVVDSWRWG